MLLLWYFFLSSLPVALWQQLTCWVTTSISSRNSVQQLNFLHFLQCFAGNIMNDRKRAPLDYYGTCTVVFVWFTWLMAAIVIFTPKSRCALVALTSFPAIQRAGFCQFESHPKWRIVMVFIVNIYFIDMRNE